MPVSFHVRYIGPSGSRRMLIQRSDDHTFWGSDEWVEEVRHALLYKNLRDAHLDVTEFQQREIDGLPCREFTCAMKVAVFGKGGVAVETPDVVEYLMKQMMVTIEYESVDPDSPLADCHVQCEVKVAGLKPVSSRKRKS